MHLRASVALFEPGHTQTYTPLKLPAVSGTFPSYVSGLFYVQTRQGFRSLAQICIQRTFIRIPLASILFCPLQAFIYDSHPPTEAHSHKQRMLLALQPDKGPPSKLSSLYDIAPCYHVQCIHVQRHHSSSRAILKLARCTYVKHPLQHVDIQLHLKPFMVGVNPWYIKLAQNLRTTELPQDLTAA